ncbi:MAG: hypothetical protein E7429_06490 [Ruminococcaceae bacterium]|nr:hypothetical protein [Oscillospiraceae bacterium]
MKKRKGASNHTVRNTYRRAGMIGVKPVRAALRCSHHSLFYILYFTGTRAKKQAGVLKIFQGGFVQFAGRGREAGTSGGEKKKPQENDFSCIFAGISVEYAGCVLKNESERE